eukprot:390263-Alexandrium_andersonii.AAC.1
MQRSTPRCPCPPAPPIPGSMSGGLEPFLRSAVALHSPVAADSTQVTEAETIAILEHLAGEAD